MVPSRHGLTPYTRNPSQIGRRKKHRNLRGSESSLANAMDRTSMARDRHLLSTGRRTVIVIRIVAIDSATTASEAQLSDDIFGTSGDGLNLKSGYNKCSYGQLLFEPLSTNARIGTDGVYTVYLRNTYVAGSSGDMVYDAALAQATADLGKSPNLLADHVMFCIPPGTTGGWIAYAAPNHWMSVYNDKWCQYPSTSMHELGKSMLYSLVHTLQCKVYVSLNPMYVLCRSQSKSAPLWRRK
jgi:Gametolysin peptidase M11